CSPQFVRLQAKLKLRNLSGLAVAEQPIVGIPAIIAVEHDSGVLVDGAGVLQCLSRAHEFGLAVRIPTFKLADGRFRHHQSVTVDSEIVVTGNHSGETIHQNAIAMSGLDVKNNPPAFSVHVAGPIIVSDDNLAVFSPAAGSHEGAAVSWTFQVWRIRSLFLLIEPGHVVI